MTKTCLIFGLGYSAKAWAKHLVAQGWQVAGTTRSVENFSAIQDIGATPLVWGDDQIIDWINASTHLLISVGPTADGDPTLAAYHTPISQCAAQFDWVGYLSTTGVYGDRNGGWVDETSQLLGVTKRGLARVKAEEEWGSIANLPLHIFRLAGIYGPNRGPFSKVLSGSARRIVKANQVFNRIHVDDIAQTLMASVNAPNPGSAYNVCDDDAAPPQDVIDFAAHLLGRPSPPSEDFETADMTPMAKSFYAESKRVRNDKIKDELGVVLKYPDYKTGLQALRHDLSLSDPSE